MTDGCCANWNKKLRTVKRGEIFAEIETTAQWNLNLFSMGHAFVYQLKKERAPVDAIMRYWEKKEKSKRNSGCRKTKTTAKKEEKVSEKKQKLVAKKMKL